MDTLSDIWENRQFEEEVEKLGVVVLDGNYNNSFKVSAISSPRYQKAKTAVFNFVRRKLKTRIRYKFQDEKDKKQQQQQKSKTFRGTFTRFN